mmetsp:Transcript_8186/g.20837  ORF Transcript_8186/g.20837 Transcript_8186/m.20837 type:complete len:155 (-) Transcript_8186:658-1122(-)
MADQRASDGDGALEPSQAPPPSSSPPKVWIDFAEQLVPLILAGRKRATTRWRVPELQPESMPVAATATSAGSAVARLTVTSVAKITVDQLRTDEELARIEDMASGEALFQLLTKFYPDLLTCEGTEQLTVVHFELVEALEPSQPVQPAATDLVL